MLTEEVSAAHIEAEEEDGVSPHQDGDVNSLITAVLPVMNYTRI
jgi:hypothetical protein